MGTFSAITFFLVIICYAMDMSVKLYNKSNYKLTKGPLSNLSLTLREINELIKNPNVKADHKVLFRRYKRIRILGHFLLLSIPIVYIINGIMK